MRLSVELFLSAYIYIYILKYYADEISEGDAISGVVMSWHYHLTFLFNLIKFTYDISFHFLIFLHQNCTIIANWNE